MDKEKSVLAELPGLGRIYLCECNSIHLSVGPVALTLAPEVFAQTAIMIRDAMEQLARIVSLNDRESSPVVALTSHSKRFAN